MRNYRLLILVLFVSAFNAVLAQNDTEQSQQEPEVFPSAKVSCGPWLQAVDSDEFTVVWATDIDAVVWVEVAPDDGSHFYHKERPKYYESEYGRRVIGKIHKVRITGLEKGTTYRYRIYQQALLLNEGRKRILFGEGFGSDVLKSKPYSVTTLDPDRKNISFSMVNDIHANDSLFRQLTGNVKDSQTDFVIFNGDMLSDVESEKQIFDGYLKSACELFASEVPIFAVRGNHEMRGKYAWEFFEYFPNRNKNAYYTFRDGPAYFICLDSGEDKPDSDIRNLELSVSDQFRAEEVEWLKQIVNTPEFKSAPIKIVVIHMPPKANGWYGTAEIDRLFMPVLNGTGIDLMLCGHEHKHLYIDKGNANNDFPILINSNLWRTDINVSVSGIEAKLVDASGNIMNTYTIQSE